MLLLIGRIPGELFRENVNRGKKRCKHPQGCDTLNAANGESWQESAHGTRKHGERPRRNDDAFLTGSSAEENKTNPQQITNESKLQRKKRPPRHRKEQREKPARVMLVRSESSTEGLRGYESG
jgi:hypothetical protein